MIPMSMYTSAYMLSVVIQKSKRIALFGSLMYAINRFSMYIVS